MIHLDTERKQTMNAIEHAEAQFETYLAELKELLAIPSVSTLPEHKPDMQRAAEWLRDHLREIGMMRAEVMPTDGHPFVYAEWLEAGDAAPTVLIYGHYDVQPPDPLDEWVSPPFEPTVRDGHLYARGATDDKGQTFANIKAVASMLAAEGALPVNVKFILEGEEESGSPNAAPFVRQHRDLLAADVVLISDSNILSPDQPSIVYGLRGMTYMEIEISGPKADLHSGAYGGTVHNPAQALAEIIAALHTPGGSVDVPGFYDKVRSIDADERAAMAALPWDEAEWREETGCVKPWGEADYTLKERIGARPTLEVNGIGIGFTGHGGKTIIPARGIAKISCRLVPDQDPDEIYELVRDRIKALTPDTVSVEVRKLSVGRPAVIELDTPAVQAAAKAYQASFGAAPVFLRGGGSIPIVSLFQQAIGAPVVLMGYGLPDDNIHSPNEKFTLESFRKGIQTCIHYLKALAADAQS
jgi:acetylornithine deacetylase/succinyl-diaminopimelate desuccinylase-like protein